MFVFDEDMGNISYGIIAEDCSWTHFCLYVNILILLLLLAHMYVAYTKRWQVDLLQSESYEGKCEKYYSGLSSLSDFVDFSSEP